MSFKKDKPTWREESKKPVPPEDREILNESEKKQDDSLKSGNDSYKDHIDGA